MIKPFNLIVYSVRVCVWFLRCFAVFFGGFLIFHSANRKAETAQIQLTLVISQPNVMNTERCKITHFIVSFMNLLTARYLGIDDR